MLLKIKQKITMFQPKIFRRVLILDKTSGNQATAVNICNSKSKTWVWKFALYVYIKTYEDKSHDLNGREKTTFSTGNVRFGCILSITVEKWVQKM